MAEIDERVLREGGGKEPAGAGIQGQGPSSDACGEGGRTLVRLWSGDFVGLEGRPVEVQVDVSGRGCPGFEIVGLAGRSIRESRERTRTALRNSGLRFPFTRRILVNLAPAAEQKDGSGFDLAVAIGILVASRQIPPDASWLSRDGRVEEMGFLAELSLDGSLLPVPGALLTAHALRNLGVRRVVVAAENAAEVALVDGLAVLAPANLREAVEVLRGTLPGSSARDASGLPAEGSAGRRLLTPPPPVLEGRLAGEADFTEVVGQEATKRALLVAAAGYHNALLVGAPGVGKTMLARRLPGILPPLSHDEALEVTRIRSILGPGLIVGLVRNRPFRAPHHTISYSGLVGGGTRVRPGEVTRAHRGVLFLDELPEFNRRCLEALREPLEEGSITITRGTGATTFPASFLLVAAMNPCPCGYLGHPRRSCQCSPLEVGAYARRVSGPLLDRIDLCVEVGAVSAADLFSPIALGCGAEGGETTRSLAERVRGARAVQEGRWGKGTWNSRIPIRALLHGGAVRGESLRLLRSHADRWGLSPRGFARCLRVARTLADIEEEARIEARHVNEALSYRRRAEAT